MTGGLVLDGVSKRFGGLDVIGDVSLALAPGARTALIGPNGAGKTTLVRLIAGMLTQDAGSISLDGRDLSPLSEADRVRAGIARTFQITTLFPALSVRDNVALAVQEREGRALGWWRPATEESRDEVDGRLAGVGLTDLADRKVADLAYGQQRLVELAMTLALGPRVLLLDEPTAGVPRGDLPLILDALAALPDDLSVLLIEHDMDVVFHVADEVVVLMNGTIAATGTPDVIAANTVVRDAYLGRAS